MKDYLSVADLDPAQLIEVLDRAAAVKKDPAAVAGTLSGTSIGLFFQKPSARTRISTEVGAAELGMTPVVLKADEIGLGEREAVSDVGAVFDRYLDALAFRVFGHDDLVTLADSAEAPVINLLSDLEHPCQALADLQTVAETRPLPETVLAFVGDGNNVAHSLMMAGAMTGMEIRVATPPGYEPLTEVLDAANAYSGSVSVTNDVDAAVSGAHVVYTDVWTSMGQEGEAAERHQHFMPYQVNGARFGQAGDGAIFLHCLPAHRGEEATDEVLDSARSRIFDQAENRLHSFKALLLHIFGR